MEKILTSMAWLGIPVSNTHAISGAIMGVGATARLSAVRWGVGKTNSLCLDNHDSSKCTSSRSYIIYYHSLLIFM
jgi:hypothetical protein